MKKNDLQDLLSLLDNSLTIKNGKAEAKDISRLRANIHHLAEVSALGTGNRVGLARYITRLAAMSLDIFPASIHDLYIARGKGEVPNTFTVPAINLRALSFDAARTVFRAALPMNAGPIIFEIARSEMGYTDQRPSEYTTNVLAAAIAEGYSGPVFIQGDHFQVSPKRYNSNSENELQAVRDLIDESIQGGFFNIDIDTSTLVDLSKTTIPEQQALNTVLSAMLAAYVRSNEPKGVTISIGGEIGEVGGQNSTEEELRAYMDGFSIELEKLSPGAVGTSKISIQTGTSHGGVVLPDGSIAEVSIDFNTLLNLSRVARNDYDMGGAVQHGASTLPPDAFGKFVESEAVEVHLATHFQNMLFDRLPTDLRDEIYAYLNENHSDERKPGMTDEQCAVGPFKSQTWKISEEYKTKICQAWEDQFKQLFTLLGLVDTRKYVDQTIQPVSVKPILSFYLSESGGEEDVSDLAD
jgi:fructose/tagatose bisphosphate aldolase